MREAMAVLSVSSLVSFNFHLWSMRIDPFHCVFNGIFDPVTKWVCFVRHVIAKMWYYPLAWRIWKMIQLKPCKSQNTLKEAIGWEWITYNPTWFRKFSLIHVVNSYLKKNASLHILAVAIIGFFFADLLITVKFGQAGPGSSKKCSGHHLLSILWPRPVGQEIAQETKKLVQLKWYTKCANCNIKTCHVFCWSPEPSFWPVAHIELSQDIPRKILLPAEIMEKKRKNIWTSTRAEHKLTPGDDRFNCSMLRAVVFPNLWVSVPSSLPVAVSSPRFSHVMRQFEQRSGV